MLSWDIIEDRRPEGRGQWGVRMAEEKRKTVRDATGQLVEGVEVGVTESIERFSDVKLEDGTTIKTKLSVISAVRSDDKFDAEGNPLYIVKSQNVVVVADSLLRKENNG